MQIYGSPRGCLPYILCGSTFLHLCGFCLVGITLEIDPDCFFFPSIWRHSLRTWANSSSKTIEKCFLTHGQMNHIVCDVSCVSVDKGLMNWFDEHELCKLKQFHLVQMANHLTFSIEVSDVQRGIISSRLDSVSRSRSHQKYGLTGELMGKRAISSSTDAF